MGIPAVYELFHPEHLFLQVKVVEVVFRRHVRRAAMVAEWNVTAALHQRHERLQIGSCRLLAGAELNFVNPAHDPQVPAIFVEQLRRMRSR